MVHKARSAYPQTKWYEWLGDILFALRALVIRAHGYSPFRLVYKSEPVFPPSYLKYKNPINDLDFDDRDVAAMAEELETIWEDTIVDVRRRLARLDEQMKKLYEERVILESIGVQHQFLPG